jgi:hypothetical protein
MRSIHTVLVEHGCRVLLVTGLLAAGAVPARAQGPPDAVTNGVTVAGGIDVANEYVFRGVRQNSTGVAASPFAELTATLFAGDGAIKRLSASGGFWNSLHTGDTGANGPANSAWYESRFYGQVGLTFSHVSLSSTYAAYVSPNDMFTTTKEIAVGLTIDDRAALGVAALNPSVTLAFELATDPGMGQLDGGLHAGRYLELGVTPRYAIRRALVAIPVRVGLSAGDYYELGGKDHTFGFVGVAGEVSVPFSRRPATGQWDIHGRVDVHVLGATTKVFNGGERSVTVATAGVRWKR